MALRRKLNAVIKNYVRLIVTTPKPAFSQWQITIWLFCYLENQTMTAFRAKPQTLITPPFCRVAASPTLFRKSHSVKKCVSAQKTQSYVIFTVVIRTKLRGDCSSRVDASALLSYPDEAAISPRWTKASEELLPSLFSLKPSRKLFKFSLCFFQLARRSTRLCNRKNTLVPCSISFREAVISLHKEPTVAPLRVIKRSFSQCFFFFRLCLCFVDGKEQMGKTVQQARMATTPFFVFFGPISSKQAK